MIMNWQEYVSLAIRTESVPDNNFSALADPQLSYTAQEQTDRRATRLLHAALGVCTEVAELYDGHTVSNWMEEVGDVLWYLAIADDTVGWYSETYKAFDKPILFYIGEVQDVLKRHIFYGTGINLDRLIEAFEGIYFHCVDSLVEHHISVGEAMVANIMKLEKRFPDKFFDAKAAIHRDVDRELEHIGADGKILVMDGEVVQAKNTILNLDEQPEELGLSKETIAETFFPLHGTAMTFDAIRELMKAHLAPQAIERMAMDLAFERAQFYRNLGALELARGYDALYKGYSGRGDRLEEISLVVMWQEAGYPMNREGILGALERWK